MDDNLHWCGQNNAINHPPVITIFKGGVVTIPKWVVYGSLLLCYPHYPIINHDKPWLSHDYAHYQPSLTFIMVD